jgi:hypothetical protein
VISKHKIRNKKLVGETCFRCGHVFALGDEVIVKRGFKKTSITSMIRVKVACAGCFEAMYF